MGTSSPTLSGLLCLACRLGRSAPQGYFLWSSPLSICLRLQPHRCRRHQHRKNQRHVIVGTSSPTLSGLLCLACRLGRSAPQGYFLWSSPLSICLRQRYPSAPLGREQIPCTCRRLGEQSPSSSYFTILERDNMEQVCRSVGADNILTIPSQISGKSYLLHVLRIRYQ